MTRLHVAPLACSTCPYRRDTPPGIWDASEYRKLAQYDERDPTPENMRAFHCHHEKVTGVDTICRGWLSVHADSVAVRLLLCSGKVLPAEIPRGLESYLYASGVEACKAGLAGVKRPSPEALRMIHRLMTHGAGKPMPRRRTKRPKR